MGKAKDLIVKPISAQDAMKIVKKIHYSGSCAQNSQIHLGVFLDGVCGGAMQFGPSLDKRKVITLVRGTGWNEFLELNRMAFADWLPRNSESRCLGYAFRFIKKNYPWVKWIISFAHGTQCGDGTIYRASGFVLTAIKRNTCIWEGPGGHTFTDISAKLGTSIVKKIIQTKGSNISENGASSMKKFKDAGYRPKAGFQLRYVYFLKPEERSNLTVHVLPFSKIQEYGAGMYKGKKRDVSSDIGAASDQGAGGGASPTTSLQNQTL